MRFAFSTISADGTTRFPIGNILMNAREKYAWISRTKFHIGIQEFSRSELGCNQLQQSICEARTRQLSYLPTRYTHGISRNRSGLWVNTMLITVTESSRVLQRLVGAEGNCVVVAAHVIRPGQTLCLMQIPNLASSLTKSAIAKRLGLKWLPLR